jgi:outer membrane protein assembly factor BamB
MNAPATAGQMTYIGGDDSFVYAIGPDAKTAWNFLAPDGTSAPTVSDGVLYVSGDASTRSTRLPARCYGRPTRRALRVQPAGGRRRVVYASCDDATLYALTAATRTTLWSY